jgi:hypothetical protein
MPSDVVIGWYRGAQFHPNLPFGVWRSSGVARCRPLLAIGRISRFGTQGACTGWRQRRVRVAYTATSAECNTG